MKIRTGFVSNSSSSSYTCEVCGEDYSGMDASLSDAEMSNCENGHTYCDSHAEKGLDDLTLEEKKELIISCQYSDEGKKEKREELKDADEDKIEEDFNDYKYDIRDSMPSDVCPCCQFIEPTDGQLMEYLLWKCKWTKGQVKADLKNDFKNYDEFLKEVNKVRK